MDGTAKVVLVGAALVLGLRALGARPGSGAPSMPPPGRDDLQRARDAAGAYLGAFWQPAAAGFGAGALVGGTAGAFAGSIEPGLGNAIGGAAGALIGGLFGAGVAGTAGGTKAALDSWFSSK